MPLKQAEGQQTAGSETGSQAVEAGSQQSADTGEASTGGSGRSSGAGAASRGRSRSRMVAGGARRGSAGRAAASILLEAVAGAGGRPGTQAGVGSQPEGQEPVAAGGGTVAGEPGAGEDVAVYGGTLPRAL